MAEIPRGELMKEFNRRVARVVAGIEQSEVRDILGEPNETRSRQETETPGDAFRKLGSTFDLDPDGIETVWVYRDPVRQRITHFIGFSNGCVVVRWKETASESVG